MHTQYLFLLLAWLISPVFSSSHNTNVAGSTLSGKVTDQQTGEPLPGVSIYVPDLKTGTVSGADGSYTLTNLPPQKILIQVSFVGYKTIIESVNVNETSTKDFTLEASVKEMKEVVVTGTSQATDKRRTPTPVVVISPLQLLQNTSSNIIDAIALQPGISQVTTGAGISKPVIRGLGYNRVVLVHDGIRQEGQQWGDEHGIEVDEFSVSKVEILKGPASLVYGPDAMAGVVHLLSAPPLPPGEISGNILGNYQSNNGLIGYSGNIAGNVKGFVWDLRYSGKQAHAYRNKYDGYVYGSGFKDNTLGGIVGLNKSWGYAHLHLSTYHLVPDITEGARDSATGKFTKQFALNDTTATEVFATDPEMRSYKPVIPHQDIRHEKAVLNTNFILGNGSLKTTLGIQQNRRQEYGDILHPDQYGLFFLLNTFNYDVRYLFPEKNKFQASAGANGMLQHSLNKGEEFLVPAYRLFDIGVFFTLKKSFEKIDLSGGLRYDNRKMNAETLLLDTLGKPTTKTNACYATKFAGFHTSYGNMSGSIGAAYQFSEHVFSKLNLSRGFRPPNIAELGANGEHEGTGRYETGNPSMKAENSLQLDYALGIDTRHISVEVDAFYNTINHFIYTRKISSLQGGDSVMDAANPVPVFTYTQGNAHLSGGELMIDIHPHPLDWLHFENSFAFVQAIQDHVPDSLKYLPFTPGPKFSSVLKGDFAKAGNCLRNSYVQIGLDNYFAQRNVYTAYSTETATPGYTLIHLGAGTQVVHKEKIICTVYLNVQNLTDVAYQSHLSRLKYTPENFTTGRTGVFNMGRNFSVKLVVPIGR